MDRRKAMKIFAGAAAVSGAGIYSFSKVFKTEIQPAKQPVKMEYTATDSPWQYSPLDPSATGNLAYGYYQEGSCMYAIFKSVLIQLADNFGEPYASFPYHMMKYGHGGIGGYGTVCGALNGAAALIGLLVNEKTAQDTLITGLYRWYEQSALPVFRPELAVLDFTPPLCISESTLCHASVTMWSKKSGYKSDAAERKERCRRLTSDVAIKTAEILNEYTSNTYLTIGHDNQNVRECMTCHGDNGKLNNTVGKMDCTSCHTESVAHKIFADPHYKLMSEK